MADFVIKFETEAEYEALKERWAEQARDMGPSPKKGDRVDMREVFRKVFSDPPAPREEAASSGAGTPKP